MSVAKLLNSPNELVGLGGLSKEALSALLEHDAFVALGAISPDYPYLGVGALAQSSSVGALIIKALAKLLGLGGSSSQEWADTMHRARTGQRLKAGIQHVKAMPPGKEKDKALAWLLGFVSHVVMDLTIHPVVELKIAPEGGGNTAHRRCEIHQDAFIYSELGVGAICHNNFLLKNIALCSAPNNKNKLDATIYNVWNAMLQSTDGPLYSQKKPHIHGWHMQFRNVLALATPGKPFAWARHMASTGAVGMDSLVYPAKPDASFIDKLQTPNGNTLSYGEVFQKAKANVKSYWDIVLRACLLGDEAGLSKIKDWSLDSGKDEAGTLAFWE